MTDQATVTSVAEAAVRELENSAEYHKRQREYHRRKCREANAKLETLRRNCERVGIIFEPEVVDHGQARSTDS